MCNTCCKRFNHYTTRRPKITSRWKHFLIKPHPGIVVLLIHSTFITKSSFLISVICYTRNQWGQLIVTPVESTLWIFYVNIIKFSLFILIDVQLFNVVLFLVYKMYINALIFALWIKHCVHLCTCICEWKRRKHACVEDIFLLSYTCTCILNNI